MRYFRLPPNLVHRKLIDLALDLANYVPSSSPHPVFELHATIFQKLKKMSVLRTVTAFAKNESLYQRIWTKYKSSKLFWRILEDNKPTKRENRGKKTVNAIRQVGHSLVTFCWNKVKSVPLRFLPSKSRLFWWLLSVNLCLLVFNSIFRREIKNIASFETK